MRIGIKKYIKDIIIKINATTICVIINSYIFHIIFCYGHIVGVLIRKLITN